MDHAVDEATRLVIRRIYNAPVAAVYAAWTDPEQMKHWMGPSDDFGPSEVTGEVRVGGRYRIVMHGPGGETHRVGGVFREVVPNRRLVYTWAWESTPERESLVTVEFRPAGAGTELRAHARPLRRSRRARPASAGLGRLPRPTRPLSLDVIQGDERWAILSCTASSRPTTSARPRRFYGKLFDWKFDDMPMESGTYTIIGVGEGTGGGLMKNPMPDGSSMWMPYVLVADIKAATAKARSLGANVMKDSQEVKDMGWLSIFVDPTGAMLGLWQTKKK